MFILINNDTIRDPSIVKLNGIQLPQDVIISIDGEKVIATSKIIDGVVVFERISRNFYEINFETTVRKMSDVMKGKYIFPEDDIVNIFKKIFEPYTVIKLENTLLNALGIFEVVIFKVSFTTVRGSKNVPMTIKCYENYTTKDQQGRTLIIP